MNNKRVKTKAMAMAVAAAMAVDLCPVTAFAVTGSQVAADGTYTSSAHVSRDEVADVDDNWTEYGVSVSLTVKDGKMTIHISLASQKIVNLFVGTAEDAAKEGAELLQPTIDTVTYADGTTEEVNGYDVPVEALDKEFDLAIIGTKQKWYDHKVSVSDPQAE